MSVLVFEAFGATLNASALLPIQIPGDNTPYMVEISSFDYDGRKDEVVAMIHRGKDYKKTDTPIVRVHSACITSQVFHSLACDCSFQFDYALSRICSENYGIMIYMVSHDGRGMGIGNKIKIFNLQKDGKNIVTASEMLGLPLDIRDFRAAASVLKDHFGVFKLKLITNNPAKIQFLTSRQIEVIEVINVATSINKYNQICLSTKKLYLKHTFDVMADILFYDAAEKPYGFLSNSFCKVQDPLFYIFIEDQEWLSAEHYYQASKFHSKQFPTVSSVNKATAAWYAEQIRLAPSPVVAKMLGQVSDSPEDRDINRHLIDEEGIAKLQLVTSELNAQSLSVQQLIRPDWSDVKDKAMKFILIEKFRQNPSLLKELKDTGSMNLVKFSIIDDYWGSDTQGNGLNKLGKMLVEIRNSLQIDLNTKPDHV